MKKLRSQLATYQIQLLVKILLNTYKLLDLLKLISLLKKDKDVNLYIILVSAKIHYYNIESAQMAKKFLGQRQFNARKIRISYDSKKYSTPDQGNFLYNRIATMRGDDKKILFGYLKKLRDEEGEMFESFLEENPDLV